MANRGSFTHKKGDPIYGIEITYGNGDTAFKTFPSLSGLKAGLKAVDEDIEYFKARWPSEGWVPVSREVLTVTPTWQPFTP